MKWVNKMLYIGMVEAEPPLAVRERLRIELIHCKVALVTLTNFWKLFGEALTSEQSGNMTSGQKRHICPLYYKQHILRYCEVSSPSLGQLTIPIHYGNFGIMITLWGCNSNLLQCLGYGPIKPMVAIETIFNFEWMAFNV